MDREFELEQQHLTETYAKLRDIEAQLVTKLHAADAQAAASLEELRDNLAFDFAEVDHSLETLVEIDSISDVVDIYNIIHDQNVEKLARARLLMHRPYFAKVRLQLSPSRPPRDIYLGVSGMDDEHMHQFIVDWRSPVAETYYNQENGHISYEANGRTIEADLLLRRQFDIERDVLKSYFDTTVAIEDPLLLAALSRTHSQKLKDITATIQREQNLAIRHEDVPALLVSGIAGSGKTSVMLQRIAYLLYRQRRTLNPAQVYLFSPTRAFAHYIDNVLPNMGERNPHLLTWQDFVERWGAGGRGLGTACPVETLDELAACIAGAQIEPADLREIAIDDTVLIKLTQVQNSVAKFSYLGPGPRLAALVCEELHDKLDRRLAQMAVDEDLHVELAALTAQEQVEWFGETSDFEDEEEAVRLAEMYVRKRFSRAHELIDAGIWLRIDRVGMRLLHVPSIDACTWLYARALLLGAADPDARYVMIDEVQDYTEAQLMVLAKSFPRAHFLMLGDENQAVMANTADFVALRRAFAATHGDVVECHLGTSYRSTPAIAELFESLLAEDQRATVSAVQQDTDAPTITECADDEWLDQVRATVQRMNENAGLVAVIAADRGRAKWLVRQLDGAQLLGDDDLPADGVVVLSLDQAKGLEFDNVVVPDAQGSVYGDDALSRRRLYTALSRATHALAVLSQGPMTPLLANV